MWNTVVCVSILALLLLQQRCCVCVCVCVVIDLFSEILTEDTTVGQASVENTALLSSLMGFRGIQSVIGKLKPDSIYWEIVRPNVLSFLLGEQLLNLSRSLFKTKRFLFLKNRRVLNVFIAVDDVQSFVLLQCVHKIISLYAMDVKINVLEPQLNGWSSSLDVKYDWVFRDCSLFCTLYGLEAISKPSQSVQVLNEITSQLVTATASSNATSAASVVEDAMAVMKLAMGGPCCSSQAFQDDTGPSSDLVAAELTASKSLLKHLGYYSPGALEFEGEWYPPGRLHHLERRLQEEHPKSNHGLIFDKERETSLPYTRPGLSASGSQTTSAAPTADRRLVEVFYSFRSPYSQLVLPRLRVMCAAHGVDILVRPVLPMVTRGLKVPREKELYIGRDAAREARLLGLPMGKLADPYAFSVAEQLGKGLDFIQVYADFQWGRGVSAGSEDGLRCMVLAAGLDEEAWGRVQKLLHSESPAEKFRRWEGLTEGNKSFLLERGLWGVPCLRYGDVVVFGQDKLWVIERLLVQDTAILNEQHSSMGGIGSPIKNTEENKRDKDVLKAIIEHCSYKL